MYAIETFKNGTKTNFFDCILTLRQARKDAKECLASGAHEVQIIKEMKRPAGHTFGARWEHVETHKRA